jgi:hypothetical protein
MSRRLHRMTRALLTVVWALALVQPAHGRERKAAAPRTSRTGAAKAEAKLGKQAASDKAATEASPSKRAEKKEASLREAATPAKPSEARPGKQAKAERKPPEKASRASTGDAKRGAKQASPAKQSRERGHERAFAPNPTAAKSLGRANDGDRSHAEKPALKPPGVARPMVRSVNSRLDTPPRAVAERTAAFRYANLEDAEVIAELNRRAIAWVPASPPLPGVRTPIRLAGPLRGVTIHSTLPEHERRTSAFEILDGRLALALDDFCALLARHDVVEIVHYTMYRPPGELPPDLNKQIRHPAGLAIDVGAVRKADGRWLAIGPHWPSDIGAKTCGEGAREHWSRPGREIVSIACEAWDLRMFHFILTPHFDAAHADHLHLEIKPDTHWFMVN